LKSDARDGEDRRGRSDGGGGGGTASPDYSLRPQVGSPSVYFASGCGMRLGRGDTAPFPPAAFGPPKREASS
jgi:hypothetical protein